MRQPKGTAQGKTADAGRTGELAAAATKYERYNRSEKGRARNKRYTLTGKRLAAQSRYNLSEKGLAAKKRWRDSEDGQIMLHLYNTRPDVRLLKRLWMQANG